MRVRIRTGFHLFLEIWWTLGDLKERNGLSHSSRFTSLTRSSCVVHGLQMPVKAGYGRESPFKSNSTWQIMWTANPHPEQRCRATRGRIVSLHSLPAAQTWAWMMLVALSSLALRLMGPPGWPEQVQLLIAVLDFLVACILVLGGI